MAGTPGPLDPGTLVGNALDTVEQGLGDVGQAALMIGAAVTALGVGWAFARRFIRGH